MGVSLSGIDHLVFIVYLVGVLALGLYLTRSVKSSGDYFLAGRRLPFWAIGMSIVVSDIGAMDMIGLGGAGYRYGIVTANWDWIGSFVAMILAAFIFIPFFWRTGVYTIPEFLGRRYNAGVRGVHSTIWLLILLFDIGAVLHVTAKFMDGLLGWGYWVSILLLAFVIGVYMIGAGLSAVVLTDVIQLIVMFVGGLAVVGLGLWKVGGWDGLTEKVTALGHERHFELYRGPEEPTPFPWTGILFGLGMVMSTAYFAGNQTIVQRCLGAKSEWDAKASMLVGALLKTFIPVLVVIPGMLALALYPDQVPADDPDQAYPVLIKNLLPPGLLGLMFAAFLAALMSSVDSILNASATLFTKDVYEPVVTWVRARREAAPPDERELLRVGRVVTLVVLISSVATASLSDRWSGVYEFIQTMLSVVAGPTLAILILGMFTRRATQWGGLAGMIVGCLTAFVLNLEPISTSLFTIESGEAFLYISWWTFLLSMLVVGVVSAFTKPWPEERIAPLLWSSRKRPAAASEEKGR